MTVEDREDWTLLAKCQGMGDALFPEPYEQRRIRSLCGDCPVRSACLAEALDNRLEYGIWGGTTERERRHLLRSQPNIVSWRSVLLHTSDRLSKV